MEELSKQERKELAKEEKRKAHAFVENKSKLKRTALWLLPLLAIASLGYSFYKEINKPLPGQLFEDLGRDHIADISDKTYNSNPPTSGPHFSVWAKNGVYDRVISDGYLLHSLEHGYIVVSYNCEQPLTNASRFIPQAFAHETGEPHDEPMETATPSADAKPLTQLRFVPPENTSWFTPENPPASEIDLPDSFSSDSCKSLVAELTPFTEKWERVIVVPRIDMDTPIALTAWRRLEKLNSVNNSRIEDFIKSFHNLGPERTME